jgi:hypothetical protein
VAVRQRVVAQRLAVGLARPLVVALARLEAHLPQRLAAAEPHEARGQFVEQLRVAVDLQQRGAIPLREHGQPHALNQVDLHRHRRVLGLVVGQRVGLCLGRSDLFGG